MTERKEEVKDYNNLSTKQKLQKARIMLQKRNLNKTGFNKFANFKYFQLSDFLPSVNEIFDELGLFSEFNIKDEIINLGETMTMKEIATLEISDNTGSILFKTPSADTNVKGANDIQNLGSKHTYLKRYLYLNALEIVEDDTVDGTIGKDESKNIEKPTQAKTMQATRKQIAMIKALYTEEEIKGMLERKKATKLEELNIKDASEMINFRQKQKKVQEAREDLENEIAGAHLERYGN